MSWAVGLATFAVCYALYRYGVYLDGKEQDE
jgi:hypothetical protein